MEVVVVVIIALPFLILAYIAYRYEWLYFRSESQPELHNAEIIKTLLSLDEKSLEEFFKLYKKEFGKGAERYARQTYRKWKAGKVRPNRHTFRRFLIHLPKVMSFDLKCEVLRRLMEEYCSKKHYELSVYTDDWEKSLAPLVKNLIDKTYTAELPKQIEEKLQWLAEDEVQIAKDILRKSQAEEGKIAVSMLRQEFQNIEILLADIEGKGNVTHQLKFPYGTINLKIKRR